MISVTDVSETVDVKEGLLETAAVDGSFIREDDDGRSIVRFYWLDAFEDPIKFPGTGLESLLVLYKTC